MQRKIAVGVGVAIAVGSIAVLAAVPAAVPRPAEHADGTACLIARVGGVAVTRADAAELALQLSPPPSPAEASRLAVDAALAQQLVRGYLAPASALRRLTSYRELLAQIGTRVRSRNPGEHARAAMAYLAGAAARTGVEYGPCFVAATPLAGAPPPAAVGDSDLAAMRATPRAIARRLTDRARKRPVIRAQLWRLAPRYEAIELGPVLADELEPALGAALVGLAPGAAMPVVTTATGTYVGRAL